MKVERWVARRVQHHDRTGWCGAQAAKIEQRSRQQKRQDRSDECDRAAHPSMVVLPYEGTAEGRRGLRRIASRVPTELAAQRGLRGRPREVGLDVGPKCALDWTLASGTRRGGRCAPTRCHEFCTARILIWTDPGTVGNPSAAYRRRPMGEGGGRKSEFGSEMRVAAKLLTDSALGCEFVHKTIDGGMPCA